MRLWELTLSLANLRWKRDSGANEVSEGLAQYVSEGCSQGGGV